MVKTASTTTLIILLSASGIVWAAETLDTITVTDTADEPAITTGEVEHSEFTGVYNSIKREELSRRDVELGEILAFEAGVQNRQIGGLGSFATISIRASDSNQTNIYLDGIKLNSGGRSAIDLSALELLNIESVDVYRGSSPLQLGHGSIGGAVNLKSLGATSKPTSSVLIGGGSFSTSRLQATHQSRIGPWDVVGAIGNLKSDNDFKFLEDNGTNFNQLDDRVEPRYNASIDQTGVLARTAYRWNADSDTKFVLQLNTKDLGVPGWRNPSGNVASFETDDQQLQLTHSINNIGNWNSSFTLFNHTGDSHFDDKLAQVTVGGRDSFIDTDTRGGKFYTEHVGSNGTFGFTTEFRTEALNSVDERFDEQNYDVERDALTAAMQYAWFNARGNLLITPGLNYQQTNDKYDGITRLDRTTHDTSKVSPQIGALLELSPTLSVRANLGRYHREPAFYELFGSRGLILGSSNLKPETGTNIDMGFSYKKQNHWKLDATLFASDRSDLITTIYNNGRGRSINTDAARVIGMELSHQWQNSSGLSTEINLTVQDATNVSNSRSLNGRTLPGEAAIAAYARVAYKQSRYRLWAEAEVKTDRFYDVANIDPAKDTNLQNVGVDWYWQRAQTSLAINNVGDDVVEDFNGFPRPGRAYFLTTTLKF